jgi:hypothetical protein
VFVPFHNQTIDSFSIFNPNIVTFGEYAFDLSQEGMVIRKKGADTNAQRHKYDTNAQRHKYDSFIGGPPNGWCIGIRGRPKQAIDFSWK